MSFLDIDHVIMTAIVLEIPVKSQQLLHYFYHSVPAGNDIKNKHNNKKNSPARSPLRRAALITLCRKVPIRQVKNRTMLILSYEEGF
ncbi:hypothetical protein [Enterobacillus tribolii]|uniref:hypothetical protein n=1 Tax=Enterobacillus tribolii TaxID=1487935 RepID=UPI0011C06AC9|nr:hypothetical protein [Enterobacillus tribolii]MBW7981275.1 hypothetical protein [Enterobacillus tribolii]